MMNGQMAAIPVFAEHGAARWMGIQAVVCSDRRAARLAVCPDSGEGLVTANVADGKTLVVDLTPATEQPEKKSHAPSGMKSAPIRRLLLLTPHIIIAEEEEERLGVFPAAKR